MWFWSKVDCLLSMFDALNSIHEREGMREEEERENQRLPHKGEFFNIWECS